MSRQLAPRPCTDLESALREATPAVSAGRPEETIKISAGALWLLSETLHAQSNEQLKTTQTTKASR